MKRLSIQIAGGALAAALLLAAGCSQSPAPASAPGGRIIVSGAWALYPMLIKWAEEYNRLHPDVRIDISAGGAGKGMADALSRTVDLGMVSREINPVEAARGAWWVSVVKDAVVPTMNCANPARDALRERGLTRNEFAEVWITGRAARWNAWSPGSTGDLPVHVYTRSDACGASETWAKYLGGNPQDLQAVGVYGDPGLAEAVRKDPLGIGYNNINFAYDAKTRAPVAGLAIIPLDLNANGRIDPEENFYATLDELTRAIAAGRYPSPPARDLHLVSAGRPANPAVAAFLRWILTDGQPYVAQAGYINLSAEKLKAELQKL